MLGRPVLEKLDAVWGNPAKCARIFYRLFLRIIDLGVVVFEATMRIIGVSFSCVDYGMHYS